MYGSVQGGIYEALGVAVPAVVPETEVGVAVPDGIVAVNEDLRSVEFKPVMFSIEVSILSNGDASRFSTDELMKDKDSSSATGAILLDLLLGFEFNGIISKLKVSPGKV